MNQERLIYKGQLSEARHKRRELELRLRGTLLQIRNVLNPYIDISMIDADILKSLVDSFTVDHADLRDVVGKISDLEDALNG